MTTATTCEKCWNERQSLGGMTFQDLATGEIWTLDIMICGTCRREIQNSVSFLRFHGANVHHDGNDGITVNSPAQANGSLSDGQIQDLGESAELDRAENDSKGSKRAKPEA